MPDFNVRSDTVNVEQIMEQIRARIREKRGVDYTEQQIHELAAVKLEKFLDPKGVRSDLLEEFRRVQASSEPPAPPNYAFGEATLFETHRVGLRLIRRLLRPLLKLFFNPNPLIQALNIQSQVNTVNSQRETARRGLDQLHFEVLHNLVLETTRMSIEIKNLKMRVESLAGRLDFNERRARALESVVAYRPGPEDRIERIPPPAAPSVTSGSLGGGPYGGQRRQTGPPTSASAPAFDGPGSGSPPQAGQGSQDSPGSPVGQGMPGGTDGPGQRSRRRRRRRGRRGTGSAVQVMGGPNAGVRAAAPADPDTSASTDAASQVSAGGGQAEDSFDEPNPSTAGSGQSEDQ